MHCSVVVHHFIVGFLHPGVDRGVGTVPQCQGTRNQPYKQHAPTSYFLTLSYAVQYNAANDFYFSILATVEQKCDDLISNVIVVYVTLPVGTTRTIGSTL